MSFRLTLGPRAGETPARAHFMEKYTIFDGAGTAVGVAPPETPDGSVSAAQRDLEAALQLLAERAQYVTGASGAAILLREEGELVCRVAAGSIALEPGKTVATNSGAMEQCVRQRRLGRNDSSMAAPLLWAGEVAGIFLIVADNRRFEEVDEISLSRLASMVLIAMEHAEAAEHPLPEPLEAEPVCEEERVAEIDVPSAEQSAAISAERARIGACRTCGFPVSQDRTFCVDCEQTGKATEALLPQMALDEENWFQAHTYTLGALAVAALTLVLLALKVR